MNGIFATKVFLPYCQFLASPFYYYFLHLNLLRKQTEGERTALTQVAACQNSVVIGDKFKRVKHTYFDEMHAA